MGAGGSLVAVVCGFRGAQRLREVVAEPAVVVLAEPDSLAVELVVSCVPASSTIPTSSTIATISATSIVIVVHRVIVEPIRHGDLGERATRRRRAMFLVAAHARGRSGGGPANAAAGELAVDLGGDLGVARAPHEAAAVGDDGADAEDGRGAANEQRGKPIDPAAPKGGDDASAPGVARPDADDGEVNAVGPQRRRGPGDRLDSSGRRAIAADIQRAVLAATTSLGWQSLPLGRHGVFYAARVNWLDGKKARPPKRCAERGTPP